MFLSPLFSKVDFSSTGLQLGGKTIQRREKFVTASFLCEAAGLMRCNTTVALLKILHEAKTVPVYLLY